MVDDLVPDLIENIKRDFNIEFKKNKKINKIQKLINDGTATYKEAHIYSIEVGDILAKILNKHISMDALPDGRMYYNIAERILNTTLGENHRLIVKATLQIQELLNKNAGLGLKGIEVPLHSEKINSLINRISSEEKFEEISWMLDEPVVTFSQNVVDEMIKANIEFQAKSGMKPTVTREVSGHDPCDWCRNLSGTYEYPNVPADVYRRHDRCRCIVEYKPSENKKQKVWSKDWLTNEEKNKVELRKTYGL